MSGRSWKKVCRARFNDWQSQRGLSVSRYCAWLGITRQAYYQAEKRAQISAQAVEHVLELVMEYRCLMPSIGTRKLYWLIKGMMCAEGVHYLSLDTDAYTRQIKGYKLSNDMRTPNEMYEQTKTELIA